MREMSNNGDGGSDQIRLYGRVWDAMEILQREILKNLAQEKKYKDLITRGLLTPMKIRLRTGWRCFKNIDHEKT